MLDQMKALGALAGLMRNRERLSEIGDEFRTRLERVSAEGSAGGGAVRVTVSGRMKVTAVRIDSPAIAGMRLGDREREMVETMIADAANEAMGRVQRIIQDEARAMARELDLPEMPGLDRLFGAG